MNLFSVTVRNILAYGLGKICWATWYHSFSPNIGLWKSKFLYQLYKKINWTLNHYTSVLYKNLVERKFNPQMLCHHIATWAYRVILKKGNGNEVCDHSWIQTFFGNTIFLKLESGWFSDTKPLSPSTNWYSIHLGKDNCFSWKKFCF